jgi:hypothetical protein
MYDRSGFHRLPGAVALAIAEAHQAQHQGRQNRHESLSEQT